MATQTEEYLPYTVLIHVGGNTWEETLVELERARALVRAKGPTNGAFAEGRAAVWMATKRGMKMWMKDCVKNLKRMFSKETPSE